MTTDLVLWQPPTAPSGIGTGFDPVEAIAGSLGRVQQGVADERDVQVRGAVAAAIDEASRRAPTAMAPVLANLQTAAVATSQQVMDAAYRRAATALLQVAPYLRSQVQAAASGAGSAATESSLSTFATQAAPYVVTGLVVLVAAYGISVAMKKERRRAA